MTRSSIAIGALAKCSGVNIETIRYYEKIGLLPEPQRTAAGYRQYGDDHVRRLRFIRRGRDLGFSIEVIRILLQLAEHPDHPCADADHLAAQHLAEVEQRIADLTRLRDGLRQMAGCNGHSVAECRIIDTLTG
jgi:MerR family transcriptional regulator, mercuric resistance operon regulatory protein